MPATTFMRSSSRPLAAHSFSPLQHRVIALTSLFIEVITLVSTRVMYPIHLNARANDPLISLRALGSRLLTCSCMRVRARKLRNTVGLDS
jgi:hypothetical protein